MPAPTPDPNEPSKMKKLISGNTEDSSRSGVPNGNGANRSRPPGPTQTDYPASSAQQPNGSRYQFLPAFWTIASVLSMAVNVILIVILLILFQMLGAIQGTANDKASGLLGGLYNNFVRMDQAVISRTIPVDANIPLDIVVPVQTTTTIKLAQPTTVFPAHVYMNTGEVIIDAPQTRVTLPAGQELLVTLDFQINVKNTIPIHLDVPVNIPLRETQLHEPFVGLQQVVEPWYCLLEPNAVFNGLQVCSAAQNPSLIIVQPTPMGQ